MHVIQGDKNVSHFDLTPLDFLLLSLKLLVGSKESDIEKLRLNRVNITLTLKR